MICKTAMMSPNMALQSLGQSDMVGVYNKIQKREYEIQKDKENEKKLKKIEMPPIFNRNMSNLNQVDRDNSIVKKRFKLRDKTPNF